MRKRILFIAVLYFCAAALPLYTVARFYSHTENTPEKPGVTAPQDSDILSKNETLNAVKQAAALNTNGSLKNSEKYESFNILDTSTGEIITVKNRDFMIGGTAAEVPSTFHTEAIKAQMLCVYTYYSLQRQNNRTGDKLDYDFSADLSIGEKYLTEDLFKERTEDNYEKVYSVYAKAADEIEGKAVTYEGEPALTVFYAISSGTTENSENVFASPLPYLVSVPSPYDSGAPGYKEELSFSKEEAEEIISTNFADVSLQENPVDWFKITDLTVSGTVLNIAVGDKTFTGQQLREAFGLRSACFDVVYNENNFVFTTRGYGHNVGMSQYGAEYLARQGADFKDIISYYYPGTDIVNI
ncbi:MAG: stage II sporulation protein D [Clostridiales bacterium]|nr:stage II sporulation protein D [Clostridiales bacterium]